MTTLVLLSLLAHGAVGEPEDVRVELADGVVVNWTRLALEVTVAARPRGVDATIKATEHEARQLVEPSMAWGVGEVQVTHDLTLAELQEDPEVGVPIRARSERWVIGEARYHASGRVELVGELPLQELLKPWMLSVAKLPPQADVQPAFTGVLLDARGTGAEPAYAPRVLYGSEVLWDGLLWDQVALFQAPVVYVPDPAHPAAARAGDHPLVLRVVEADGSDLEVGREDRIRWRTGLQGARIVGEGTVVVVIDP